MNFADDQDLLKARLRHLCRTAHKAPVAGERHRTRPSRNPAAGG